MQYSLHRHKTITTAALINPLLRAIQSMYHRYKGPEDRRYSVRTVKFKSPSTLSGHHFNGILNQVSPPLFSLPIPIWKSEERPL